MFCCWRKTTAEEPRLTIKQSIRIFYSGGDAGTIENRQQK
jgi:hypothetical protein